MAPEGTEHRCRRIELLFNKNESAGTTCLHANTGLRGPRPVTAKLVYTGGQETEEPPPIVEEKELVLDVIADPPSAGDVDVDLPGSVREDVPDLEDMELTDSLIGRMVDDSLLRLLRGPDLLLGAKAKSDEGVDFVLPFGGTKIRYCRTASVTLQ